MMEKYRLIPDQSGHALTVTSTGPALGSLPGLIIEGGTFRHSIFFPGGLTAAAVSLLLIRMRLIPET